MSSPTGQTDAALLSRASQGEPAAQIELAKCYLDGIGGPVDTELASLWLQRAARQGNDEAAELLHALQPAAHVAPPPYFAQEASKPFQPENEEQLWIQLASEARRELASSIDARLIDIKDVPNVLMILPAEKSSNWTYLHGGHIKGQFALHLLCDNYHFTAKGHGYILKDPKSFILNLRPYLLPGLLIVERVLEKLVKVDQPGAVPRQLLDLLQVDGAQEPHAVVSALASQIRHLLDDLRALDGKTSRNSAGFLEVALENIQDAITGFMSSATRPALSEHEQRTIASRFLQNEALAFLAKQKASNDTTFGTLARFSAEASSPRRWLCSNCAEHPNLRNVLEP